MEEVDGLAMITTHKRASGLTIICAVLGLSGCVTSQSSISGEITNIPPDNQMVAALPVDSAIELVNAEATNYPVDATRCEATTEGLHLLKELWRSRTLVDYSRLGVVAYEDMKDGKREYSVFVAMIDDVDTNCFVLRVHQNGGHRDPAIAKRMERSVTALKSLGVQSKY
ncbi:hypothetical protein JJL56_24605 [Azospirillum sp. YIM DDC1]|uniref:Lipoprotein n=2 Tax=Azospirillum TaxID=191 RepID=A0ABU4PHF8_AZOBR|nr:MULTISPECIES: hypothetical protein [Azospirillum]MBK4722039.1 hypothetical protein [Azospirillum aestuarii]MDX5955874.1 hypothetical protein [Azospirillum brasilense]